MYILFKKMYFNVSDLNIMLFFYIKLLETFVCHY